MLHAVRHVVNNGKLMSTTARRVERIFLAELATLTSCSSFEPSYRDESFLWPLLNRHGNYCDSIQSNLLTKT